jgi:hypothetical protein
MGNMMMMMMMILFDTKTTVTRPLQMYIHHLPHPYITGHLVQGSHSWNANSLSGHMHTSPYIPVIDVCRLKSRSLLQV